MRQQATALATIPPEARRNSPLPTVDVVIPCYNYGRFLPRCVNSVLSQRAVAPRILIIDDASQDNSSEIGQDLASQHDEIEYRRHSTNKGHIATYNEGLLGWSSASYVVLLSADDMLAPGALERAVNIMEADPTVGMVYGRTFHFHEETQLAEIPVDASGAQFTRYLGSEWLTKRFRAGYNVITSPEVVVRGSVHKAVGGYRKELPHSGDLEMWLRIAAVSDIAYLHHVQAYYRVHSSSMQRTKYKTSFLDIVHRKAAFDLFVQHHPDVPHIHVLQRTLNRILAREALWDACRAYDRDRIEDANVEELVQFAMATDADYEHLPEYFALQRRKRLGPAICNRTQIFVIPASIRWLDRRIKRTRMLQHGI